MTSYNEGAHLVELELAKYKREQMIHNSRVNAAKGVAAETTRISGEFPFQGAGEGKVDVIFPVMFMEKPIFTFGAEVPDSQTIVSGKYPTISAAVAEWKMLERPPITRLYYGCSVIVVVGGYQSQKLIVHWSLEGTALMNPGLSAENFT